jgi:hypothetical protein
MNTSPSGSLICWSRREDPYVPVVCGSCERERIIISNNTTREDFTGICRACVNGEDWEDKTLPNGSIVFRQVTNRQSFVLELLND